MPEPILQTRELGTAVRTFDWTSTSLGDVLDWPLGLKTAVDITLGLPTPALLLWGREAVVICNEAYVRRCGATCLDLLGRPAALAGVECSELNANVVARAQAGEHLVYRNLVRPLLPDASEPLYDASYTPIKDVVGAVSGVLVVLTDGAADSSSAEIVYEQVGSATEVQELHDALEAERVSRSDADRAREHIERIFNELPLPLVILRGPEHRFELVSKMYEALVGRPILGRTVREAFPDIAGQGWFELLDGVYSSGQPIEFDEMKALADLDGDGVVEERFLRVACHALRDSAGEVYGIAALNLDVTEQVLARGQLEVLTRDAQLARGRAEDERARLSRLLSQAPFGVSTTLGPDHVLTSVNPFLRRIIGYRDAVGERMRDAFPEPETHFVHETIAHVYASGDTVVRREQPVGWDHTGNGVVDEGFFDLVFQPIFDDADRIEGVIAFTVDVTQSVLSKRAVAEARDQAEQARLVAESTREYLKSIVAAIPAAVAVNVGPSAIYDLVNPAYQRLVGPRPLLGRTINEAFPEFIEHEERATRHRVYRTGEPESSPEVRVVSRVADSAEATQELYYNLQWAALRDNNGSVTGVVLAGMEVTEQVRQREWVETTRRELELAQIQLEARIGARTAELAATNRKLEAEIAERARAELARKSLLRRLASAREDEQRRTARDLHDQVGQTLTALTLAVQTARNVVPLPPATSDRLAEVQRLAEELGRDVHDLAIRLRPTALDDFGLQAALSQLFDNWSHRVGVDIDFQPGWLGEERLPADVETVLYRVIQEALTNVARHACAQHVSVVLERHDGQAIAVIEDDGAGFDPEEAGTGRLGLVGMQERVSLAGGTLDIESESGRGTTIIARVPASNPEPQPAVEP